MFAPIAAGSVSSRRKLRAFIACIKEDGLDKFSQYIAANNADGLIYHRNGIYGDYDLDTEDAILALLKKRSEESI
jgi:hypothetical protein